MPRAAGCERRGKCSQIDSAYTEVKDSGWKGVDDGECNRNDEAKGSEEKVGQNASMFH